MFVVGNKNLITNATLHTMKTTVTVLTIILTVLTSSLCFAGTGVGQPQSSGLIPYTGTHFANTNFYDNGGAESDNLAIAANGNVIVGWEDDGGGIYDFEGVWSLFDLNLNLLTLPALQTNRYLDVANDWGYFQTRLGVINTYLSMIRSDGSYTPAVTGWGPKVEANMFGDGIGFGGSYWWIGLEVAELYDVNLANTNSFDNDMPALQLLNNDGTALHAGPMSGRTNLGILTYDPQDVSLPGSIRIADWGWLSNGHIILAGESRQDPGDYGVANWNTISPTPTNGDWSLTGQTSGKVPVFKILTTSGATVKGYTASSSDNSNNNDMWHGVGVTANGFALKWNKAMRLFDNDGNPITGNINLATLTGHPEAQASGDRGDNTGFHGNGTDGYIFIDKGVTNYNGGNPIVMQPWITVINTNGTVRWSRSLFDTVNDPAANNWKNNFQNVDAWLAPDGRVIAVFSCPETNTVLNIQIFVPEGQMFSPCGDFIGNRFYLSEWNNPTNGAINVIGTTKVEPRVNWRGTNVAVAWMDWNPPYVGLGAAPVMGVRTFSVAPSALPTNLAIQNAGGGNVMISWSGGGTLQGASSLSGPWTPIYDCSPSTKAASGGAQYYRVLAWQ